MERKDLLLKNFEIFKSNGIALEMYAKKTVRVLVIWGQDIMCQMVSYINLNKLNVISPELINS